MRPDEEPITSFENPQIRLARALHQSSGRRRHSAFLVEGLRLVEAAAGAAMPKFVLHAPGFGRTDARERALLRRLGVARVPIRPVSERVLHHIADTVTPQGVVAVMPLPLAPAPIASTGNKVGEGAMTHRISPLFLVLDEVGDPGNAGTLLRSAAAAGVTRLFASQGTVDIYSPKVVRAGAGAHFLLPVATGLRWEEIDREARDGMNDPVQMFLAVAGGKQLYWDVDWRGPAALIVSNEARGASSEAQAFATGTVTIPMQHMESLNAGVAGSVILFEALRQRMTSSAIQSTAIEN
jgi:RNA methyltransferase, TrmH family